ncbi:DEAD/DEAH box helicase [Leptospira wolffii]|uniref:DEAD/DEAH box helicase n=1 Tax=Leptospira wolffii TaxID=409998 RepID=UPI000307B069|nr:DEAD/DEAH box helicase family protein [Leptospira wolffii]EPG64638.1 type III restriction enzyme, res subunit [Leptospira wolffii serovar Khorat str. Khorat-H2]
MKLDLFKILKPFVFGNPQLRIPQIECFEALRNSRNDFPNDRELGIVLPVGCGKTGCITLAPFALCSKRTLVISPNLIIAEQLISNFDPSNVFCFYKKFNVLTNNIFPELSEIRGTNTNQKDLELADVVVTNIHQLGTENNRWLKRLSQDFFDLILFDEGHHSLAETWTFLKMKFPKAYIVNFSATPVRADGERMPGKIIYSFPIAKAIKLNYVKNLKAIVLNPEKMKYLILGSEEEIGLERIVEFGKELPAFRRAVVSSKESLDSIVNASITELKRIRQEARDDRPKIIASALNFKHCKQIVEAYKEKGLRSDYIHSRKNSQKNNDAYRKLENHELDVIVQVKKLGEGFDHSFLCVAAVFSVHLTLAPFLQFIGRIMRTNNGSSIFHPLNQGVVVFHAGGNIIPRWNDLREFSEADQEYFSQLLPMSGIDFSNSDELVTNPDIDLEGTEEKEFIAGDSDSSFTPKVKSSEIQPKGNQGDSILDNEMASPINRNGFQITEQIGLDLESLPLIQENYEAMEAIRKLSELGFSGQQVLDAMNSQPIIPKVQKRQEARYNLNERVKAEVDKILNSKSLSAGGYELDKNHRGKTNYVILKSAIDLRINDFIKRKANERSELSQEDLDLIDENFDKLVELV